MEVHSGHGRLKGLSLRGVNEATGPTITKHSWWLNAPQSHLRSCDPNNSHDGGVTESPPTQTRTHGLHEWINGLPTNVALCKKKLLSSLPVISYSLCISDVICNFSVQFQAFTVLLHWTMYHWYDVMLLRQLTQLSPPAVDRSGLILNTAVRLSWNAAQYFRWKKLIKNGSWSCGCHCCDSVFLSAVWTLSFWRRVLISMRRHQVEFTSPQFNVDCS